MKLKKKKRFIIKNCFLQYKIFVKILKGVQSKKKLIKYNNLDKTLVNIKKQLTIFIKHFYNDALIKFIYHFKLNNLSNNYVKLLNDMFKNFTTFIFNPNISNSNKLFSAPTNLYYYHLSKSNTNNNNIIIVNFDFFKTYSKNFKFIFIYLKIIFSRLVKIFYNNLK